MIDINQVKNIYMYGTRVDMRLGMYKIELLLSLSFSPMEILNSAFIFVSRNKQQLKIFYEDEFGKWLMIYKLSYSKFRIMDNLEKLQINKQDLTFLLKGVALIEERKKYASF